jgi:hypothetical protein
MDTHNVAEFNWLKWCYVMVGLVLIFLVNARSMAIVSITEEIVITCEDSYGVTSVDRDGDPNVTYEVAFVEIGGGQWWLFRILGFLLALIVVLEEWSGLIFPFKRVEFAGKEVVYM